MKTIKMTAAMAAALALLSACGGGGGDGGANDDSGTLVAVPVGAWTHLEGSTGRQLYVLPAATAGGQSEAWGLEFEVVGSASSPTTLVYAPLTASTTSLSGTGGVQDLTVTPVTYVSLPFTVVPSVAGTSLTLTAGSNSWTLSKATLPAATDGLWTGAYESTANSGALEVNWTLSGTTIAASDNTGCTYAGTIAPVDHADLAGVVRIDYASTNTDTAQQASCGSWQGIGTVARDEGGDPVGRTLWLRKSDGSLLQRVSLSPAVGAS